MVGEMEQTGKKGLQTTEDPVTQAGFSCPRREQAMGLDDTRLAELEMENRRLNRLVAELVLKNQQLRNAR